METKNIWIDTDLSVGMKRHIREGYCDVDDGYALLQLFKAENIHIKGISAVFGNTLIDDAYRLCQQMSKEFAKNEIPVYKGAGTAIDLSKVETNDAVEALATALKETQLTILAIGPATNVGILLLQYPELKNQIKEVVLVAGRRKPTDYFKIGNQGNHARDLNFDLDNQAFNIMFEAGVPVTLCPFEISSKVWIGSDDLKKLDNGEAGNKWLAEHSQPWLAQWINQGASGFNPFDVLASHYIISPEDIISEDLKAQLEIHPDDTVKDNDKLVFKNYLLCRSEGSFPVKYCHDVVSDYHEKLMDSLTKKS
ncbi:nucleoside hydrolase [Marivirga harenae]|uniref:nucleoside hydrolase n=1 Tax=Marivirga harenae TaxID=2010992 RepID=UPI0026DFE0FF|nr:nucleoside hydrolase [Marivirga harenae]WKV12466.1 nucleoside hydrolase [Marivirga harenae]